MLKFVHAGTDLRLGILRWYQIGDKNVTKFCLGRAKFRLAKMLLLNGDVNTVMFSIMWY